MFLRSVISLPYQCDIYANELCQQVIVILIGNLLKLPVVQIELLADCASSNTVKLCERI